MIKEINIQFNIGDKVWHKNLVTNEAVQTTIKSYMGYISADKDKEASCVMYHCEDGDIIVNIEGKPAKTNVFATKEECDSWPTFDPNIDLKYK